MKVLTINGSPELHGCTDRALQEIETILKEQGFEITTCERGSQGYQGLHWLSEMQDDK